MTNRGTERELSLKDAIARATRDAKPSKTLIIGRSGAGKDYLKDVLASEGWSFVKSYATRPKRSPSEDTHIFISQAEADQIPRSSRVASTTINGYEYFATKEQVRDCDGYIIDPKGAAELLESMPNTTFDIVYIRASSDSTRKEMALGRANDAASEERVFSARNASEDDQFTAFEKSLESHGIAYPNCRSVTVIVNDFNPATIRQAAHKLSAARDGSLQPSPSGSPRPCQTGR